MACVEVTGELCWEEPEPTYGVVSAFAKPLFVNSSNNLEVPSTHPYIAPTATWESGYSGTLPTFTGQARRGRYLQLAPGSENTRWAYTELDMRCQGGHLRVTFEFEVGDDLVVEVTSLNSDGFYKIALPDDIVTAVHVRTVSPVAA